MKKGYYVQHVKDNLWSVFRFTRIRPFEDNYTKEQMKLWKESEEVKAIHDDLYKPSNPDDESSDTFFTLIIKSVFTEKELTNENVIWTQSVLESIFDVEHLSTKIDSDIIDEWKDAIKSDGQVRLHVNCVVFFLSF